MKTLVILAGGKSSRMGQDKVLLEVAGRTFIERIFLNALTVFERVIISTDSEGHASAIKSLPVFETRDPEIVTDIRRDAGPLGGIGSVFESSDVSRFSIIPVDVPFADMRVLEALYDRCLNKAVYLKIGNGRPEPLIAAYDRTGYEDIRTALDSGLTKMRLVFPEGDTDTVTDAELKARVPGLETVDFEQVFMNCNTPEEYERVLQDIR